MSLQNYGIYLCLALSMETWPQDVLGAVGKFSVGDYDIDPHYLSKTKTVTVYRARVKDSREPVLLKKFNPGNDRHKTEVDIFHRMAVGIPKTADSYFVRLLHSLKSQHNDDVAMLVIEDFDKKLSDAIHFENIDWGRHTSDARTATSSMQPLLSPPAIETGRLFKTHAYHILQAVDILHKLGIYHLDLKPSNIGLTLDGAIKLLNFGSACTHSVYTYVGSIEYSAPEMNLAMVRRLEKCSIPEPYFQMSGFLEQLRQLNKMDSWSVGCTIYEMFTGKLFSDTINEYIGGSYPPLPPKSSPYESDSEDDEFNDESFEYVDIQCSTVSTMSPSSSPPGWESIEFAERKKALRIASSSLQAICSKVAAYYDIQLSLNSETPTKDEAVVTLAKRVCPNIFSHECIKIYEKKKREKFLFLENHASVGEGEYSWFQYKMDQLKSDEWQYTAHLGPSATKPEDLVDLLAGLLMFDYDKRITPEEALTRYPIFDTMCD